MSPLGSFFRSPFSGHKGTISSVSISPDGSKAVSGAHAPQFFDRDARLWDLASGRLLCKLVGNSVGVFSTGYSPNGDCIATGGGGAVKGSQWVYDHAVRLWDEQGSELRRFGEDLFMVHSLAFSPDGKYLLTGSSNHARIAQRNDGSCCRLWKVSNGKQVRQYGTHLSAASSVAFSPDGQYVLAGSNGLRADGSIPGGKTVKMGRLGDGSFGTVSEVNQSLSTEPSEQTLRVFEFESGRELDRFHCQRWINSTSFSPDGAFIISAGRGVTMWNFKTGERQRDLGDEASFVHCVQFSPCGRYFAVGTGGRNEMGAPYENCHIYLYDSNTLQVLHRFDHEYPVEALAFAPDGKHILAGGEHGELRLWNVEKPTRTSAPQQDPAVKP